MTEDASLAKNYFDLGLKALYSKDLPSSEDHFRRSLKLAPNRPSILINLSSVLLQQEKWSEALIYCKQLLTVEPKNFDGYINLGVCYLKIDEVELALSTLDKAIMLNPQSPKGWINKGNVLLEKGFFYDAKACFESSLRLNEHSVEALIGLGNLQNELKNYKIGLEYLTRAHELEPHNHLAQWNKALSLLRLGYFEEGWKLYESRWHVQGMSCNLKHENIPLWLGESLENKTILIHSEQGFGDAIQMSRFLPLLARERRANVIFQVPPQLLDLMQSLGSEIKIIDSLRDLEKATISSIDFQCPVMSLPLAFNTKLSSIPTQIPYLYADQRKIVFWKEKLAHLSQGLNILKPFRIGVTWQGSGHYAGIKNQKRDAPPSLLNAIAAHFSSQNIEFHLIQKEGWLKPLDNKLSNLLSHQEDLNSFADTAALISELDLVISVDTAVGHLAGALGKDTLILLPDPPDFMSLIDTSKSPWYPNVEFLRQVKKGVWTKEQIINAIANRYPKIG